MEKTLRNLCEQLLYEEDTPFVSVKKLYDLVVQEKEDLGLNVEDFVQQLQAEENAFTIVDVPVSTDFILDDAQQEYLSELEYISGPFVCLANKNVEQEEYATFLLDRVQGIIYTLEQMYTAKAEQGLFKEGQKEEIESVLGRAYEIKGKLEAYKTV